MLTAACPKDDVAPRITSVCPSAISRLRNKQVQAVAYVSGMAARSDHDRFRFDGRDLRHGGASELGVTAVDRPAEPAHQRRHLGPDRELPAGARLDQADALDPADVRDLGPFFCPHAFDPENNTFII
jgi:hypothetical protein